MPSARQRDNFAALNQFAKDGWRVVDVSEDNATQFGVDGNVESIVVA
jgi:Domain of unknown function (DUF4177)